MCMEMLQKLVNGQLSFTVAGLSEIDKLRLLDAAGLVKAYIPPVHADIDDAARQDPAQVIEITPRGRRALIRMPDERLQMPRWH